MSLPRPRLSLALTPSALRYATVLIAAVGAVVALTALVIGPTTAQAAYLAVMFLLSPSRSRSARIRVAAAATAVVVAISGYLVGPLGLSAIIAGLIVVSVVQAAFRLGDVAGMSRAPVNFVVFAALSSTGVALWQVALGSLIGAGFVLLLARVMPAKGPEPEHSARRDRVDYGVTLTIGVVLIVLVAEWVNFEYTGWALLSYCMILAVGVDNRVSRVIDRVTGTVIGAIVATVVSLAAAPVPIAIAVIATVLCLAYLRTGNYTMFVTLLTPAVLLTTSSEASAFALGLGRVEAVFAAGAIALLLTGLAGAARRIKSPRARASRQPPE